MNPAGRGVLMLVVGASGVGKDSVLGAARMALAADAGIVFARRCITRPPQAGGEAHIALTPTEFHRRRLAGGFLLHWQAHGLDYGLPAGLKPALRTGRMVVANVSRGVLGEARRRYPPVRVVEIVATPSVLAARLRARGRESEADIARRLQRATADRPAGVDVIRLANNGALDDAVAAFLQVLRSEHRHIRAAAAATVTHASAAPPG